MARIEHNAVVVLGISEMGQGKIESFSWLAFASRDFSDDVFIFRGNVITAVPWLALPHTQQAVRCGTRAGGN